jgi:aspartate ammonia-lyase
MSTNRTSPSTRVERDTLGEMQVPADAYYGPQTARAVENFPISGLRLPREMVEAMAAIKWAAAETHASLGLLDRRVAEAIVSAAREVRDGKLADQFVVDVFQAGAGTSFHMNVNEVVANRAIEILGGTRGEYALVHPNDHVNMGQSTNDVIPTAMRLAALPLVTALADEVARLSDALAAKAREFDGIVKSGRTHLQDAVPIRLGQEFGGYAHALARSAQGLRDAAEWLRELGIGGSAAGTGLNTHPAYRAQMVERLSAITGESLRPSPDLFEAMQSMQPFAVASAAMRNTALEVIRIANDLRLLSSGPRTGLAEIRLPAVQPGSSIMPGKVNPVMAECTNMVCFHVLGNDAAVSCAVQAGQLELNVMMPIIAHNLLGGLAVFATTLRLLRERCVAGITADAERCRMYAESTIGLATILNPVVGYEAAAKVAKDAMASGRSMVEAARATGVLSADEAARVFDPATMTEPGILDRSALEKARAR